MGNGGRCSAALPALAPQPRGSPGSPLRAPQKTHTGDFRGSFRGPVREWRGTDSPPRTPGACQGRHLAHLGAGRDPQELGCRGRLNFARSPSPSWDSPKPAVRGRSVCAPLPLPVDRARADLGGHSRREPRSGAVTPRARTLAHCSLTRSLTPRGGRCAALRSPGGRKRGRGRGRRVMHQRGRANQAPLGGPPAGVGPRRGKGPLRVGGELSGNAASRGPGGRGVPGRAAKPRNETHGLGKARG